MLDNSEVRKKSPTELSLETSATSRDVGELQAAILRLLREGEEKLAGLVELGPVELPPGEEI